MAVENKYINSDVVANKKAVSAFVHGGQPFAAVVTFEVAAADSDGSVYRLLANVDPELIPVQIDIANDAITGGTDYDLGFYEPLIDGAGGTVIDKDALMDGADLSSAHTRATALSGLSVVDLANAQKRIYELAGHTASTKKLGYDIALTANTVGTAAGTITVLFYFVQG